MRAQKRPKERRRAVLESGAYVKPARGDHLLFWSGIWASSAYAPVDRTWFGFKIGLSGLLSRSYRTPAVTVNLGEMNHWS